MDSSILCTDFLFFIIIYEALTDLFLFSNPVEVAKYGVSPL